MSYFDVLRRKPIWEWLEGFKHRQFLDSNAKEWSWNSELKIVWFVWPLGTANTYYNRTHRWMSRESTYLLCKMKSRLLTLTPTYQTVFEWSLEKTYTLQNSAGNGLGFRLIFLTVDDGLVWWISGEKFGR